MLRTFYVVYRDIYTATDRVKQRRKALKIAWVVHGQD